MGFLLGDTVCGLSLWRISFSWDTGGGTFGGGGDPMENPAGTFFRPDGIGVADGHCADPDRPKESVPFSICFAGSREHVQPDRHGADEAVQFFYRVRFSTSE